MGGGLFMKKNILGLLVVAVLLINASISLKADELPIQENDVLSNSSDYEEISALEDEILSELREISGVSEGLEQIDFSKGIKVYINTDILQLNTDNKESILSELHSGDYVWVIPFTIDNENYQVTLGKGMPLSEEAKEVLTPSQQQHIIEQEGKWGISEISRGTVAPYMEQLENKEELDHYSQVVFIGSIPGIAMPMALCFDSQKATEWVGLGFSYPVIEDNIQTRSSSDIYDFQTLVAAAKTYDTGNSSDLNGGMGAIASDNNTFSKILIYVISFAAVIVIAGVFFIERKKYSV